MTSRLQTAARALSTAPVSSFNALTQALIHGACSYRLLISARFVTTPRRPTNPTLPPPYPPSATTTGELIDAAHPCLLGCSEKQPQQQHPPPLERLADAYAVQRRVSDAVAGRTLGRVVGWKVGATNAATQARMGLDAPFYGPLLSRDLRASPETLSAAANAPFRVRGVEAEYVVALARGLPHRGGDGAGAGERHAAYTLAEVAAAVEWVCPAVEVCASRFAAQPASTLLGIADGASHGCLVVARQHRLSAGQWGRLRAGGFTNYPVTLSVNATVAAVGDGSAVLGDPLVALAWLANALAAAGRPLGEGDMVTTGTMTGLTPVRPGDDVVARFLGMGSVRVTLEADGRGRPGVVV